MHHVLKKGKATENGCLFYLDVGKRKSRGTEPLFLVRGCLCSLENGGGHFRIYEQNILFFNVWENGVIAFLSMMEFGFSKKTALACMAHLWANYLER